MATVAVPNVSIGHGQGSFSAPQLVETRQVDQYVTEYIYEITCIPAAGWTTESYVVTQTMTAEWIDPPYLSEVYTAGPNTVTSFKEGTDNVIRLDSSDIAAWGDNYIYDADYHLPGWHYRYVVTALDVQICFRRLPVQIHLLGKPADGSHGTTHGYFEANVSGMSYGPSSLVYTDRGPSSEDTMTCIYYNDDPAVHPSSLTLTAHPVTIPSWGGAPDNVFRAWIVNGTTYTENPKTISLEGYNGTTVEVVGWFGCNKILKDARGDVLKDSEQADAILKC